MTHDLRPRLVPPGTPLSRPLVPGHVHLGLGLHTDRGTVPVDDDLLVAMGLTVEEAFREAAAFLDAESSELLRPVDTVPGMFFATCDDDQTASRMAALPRRTTPLGGWLVAVPGANQLLCIPVDSMDAVEALRVMASSVGPAFHHAGRPISDQIFWHDGASWSVVRVERDEVGDLTVLPPSSFFDRMRQVASMAFVHEAAEA